MNGRFGSAKCFAIETWHGRPINQLDKPALIKIIHALGDQLEEFYDPEEIQMRAYARAARPAWYGGCNGEA